MDLTRAALILFGFWMLSGIGRTLLAIGNRLNGNLISVPLPILNGNYLPYILFSPLLPVTLWPLRRKRIGILWFLGRWSWAFWVALAPFSWWMIVLIPFVAFTWATQASRNS